MGCTPSIHVNETRVVYCRGSGDSPSYSITGIQGQFRNTENGEELPFADSDSPLQPSESNSLLTYDRPHEKEDSSISFGPMCLMLPTIKVLIVFPKEDAQTDALKWAAEKLNYDCALVHSPEQALESFVNNQHHLVLVDVRQYKAFDPISLCRSLRATQGSQYSCIVAVVKKNVAEKEDGSILPLLKAGYNRWFPESCNLGYCLNELIQLEHNDIAMQVKLKAAQALFTAIENCRDGIIITNANHNIQFMNHTSEKIVGCTTDEMLGKSTRELFQSESVKADVLYSINVHVSKGREWEGKLFHKRKSGELTPTWSRVMPVEIYDGAVEHLVYIKEFPGLPEKQINADTVSMNRRQSFARFHAMTIEAPITKVINMLLATLENCPLPIAHNLDRAVEILRSAELYSPPIPGLQNSEDKITSDLFSGLVTAHKTYRKASYEQNVRGQPLSPYLPSVTLPSLNTAPKEVKKLLQKQCDWNFDIFSLEKITEKRPLIWLGMSIFTRFNVCNTLGCSDGTLKNWLSLVEANYRPNPYHNSTHAADVLQATAYFLLKPRLKAIFDPLDEAICLIAAAVHDLDHPGKNSAFLCNSSNELAILYNDISVLESHHAALAFKLTTSNKRVNIFRGLQPDTFRAVRQSIIDMVLATEMTKHFEHLSKFVNIFAKSVEGEECFEAESTDMGSPELARMASHENIILVKRMLIKCADVSNPVRPLDSCIIWANRIADEYCSQTDEEKSLGLPVVMPAFDRTTCSIPKSQISFIEYFINDMFDAWDAFGEFPELMEQLSSNYQYWKEEEHKRTKEA